MDNPDEKPPFPMVESIILDEESLLSPDEERFPQSLEASADETESDEPQTFVASLDSTNTEKADDKLEPSISSNANDDISAIEAEIEKELNTITRNGSSSDSVPKSSEAVSENGKPNLTISSYFDDDDEEKGSADPFQSITSSEMNSPPVHEGNDALHLKVEEAVPVAFEEDKGEGKMKFVGSMQNVSKFFTNDGTAEEESKNFFEHFTAEDDGNENSPINSPIHDPRERTISQSSVTSPIPCTAVQGQMDEAALFLPDLSMSDKDRSVNAWIPTEETRQALIRKMTGTGGMWQPPADMLTKPSVIEETLINPLADLVKKHLGEEDANRHVSLSLQDVSKDKSGLKKLITAECLHEAVKLTSFLLTSAGQGINNTDNIQGQNTPETLQIWFTRISLLMKLRHYSQAEAECAAFGNLDRPDLYYEYYPDLYPGCKGSMVPFEFRVLLAELPQYLGKPQDSLDRLHYLQAIVQKILSNLKNGLAEDSSMVQLNEDSVKASLKIWNQREDRLLYSISNCLLGMKDYYAAITVLEKLQERNEDKRAAILGSIGRIYVQMGDMASAEKIFAKCLTESNKSDLDMSYANLVNSGLLELGRNQFSGAYNHFKKASELQVKNVVLAMNNMAVCLLYMGQLREALDLLESLLQQDPTAYLQEGLLFNLCTLFELESSQANQKKINILALVNQYKTNSFNLASLKI